MKLFIWADPYPVAYGSSAFFAVAETVEEARKIAVTAPNYAFVQYEQEHNSWREDVKLGEPTRVVDLPCGEWHKWEE